MSYDTEVLRLTTHLLQSSNKHPVSNTNNPFKCGSIFFSSLFFQDPLTCGFPLSFFAQTQLFRDSLKCASLFFSFFAQTQFSRDPFKHGPLASSFAPSRDSLKRGSFSSRDSLIHGSFSFFAQMQIFNDSLKLGTLLFISLLKYAQT